MKKTIATLSAALFVAGSLVTGGAAQAAGTQEAQGVSAYYRVDLGYMVGWERLSNRSGVTGFTVTANDGHTCVVRGSTATQCTFKARDLGYTGSFNFTVTTNGRSGALATSVVSNTVGAASIPSAPLAVAAQAVSPTEVYVEWVPSSKTGNLSIYGYQVTYWKSNSVGGPDSSTRVDVIATDVNTTLTVDEDTLYIINVATCNALGCNSADYWVYAATNPNAEAVASIEMPSVMGGGRADTTCFSDTETCAPLVADPSTYPVVDPTATEVNDPELPTKFMNRTMLTFSGSYSLATWGPIGISWFSKFLATSKSYTLGFTTTPHIWSITPATCEIVDSKLILKAKGICRVQAYVDGNGTFKQSNIATDTIRVN
jgi:hypothetical protein